MANKIGDTSMGGDRITKLGEPQVSDDAATKGYADGLIAVNTGVYVKFSGLVSLGIAPVVAYFADNPAGALDVSIGYPLPRDVNFTDMWLNFFVNTGNKACDVTVRKNNVATTLTVPAIIGFTGKVHLGHLDPAVVFATDDLLDIVLTADAGAGDIAVAGFLFGQMT